MRRVLGIIVLAIFACCAAAQSDANGARQLLQLVNQERAKTGAPALEWDDHLASAAMAHAQLMAERKELSHQFEGEPPLRLRIAATGLRFNDDAENVAFDDSIPEAHDNLMNSPGHRKNILNPSYNAIGIAVIPRGQVLYIVEDFARKLPKMSDAEVAERVLAAFNEHRRAAGLRPVARNGDLHAAACEMAQLDHVNTSVIHAPNATSFVGFTTFEPEELPSSLQTRARENFSAMAVGACYAKSLNYPSGVTWVAVALYP